MHQNSSPFRVSVVDSWALTDNRPETVFEGRHWLNEYEHRDKERQRPLLGEASGSFPVLKTKCKTR